MHILVVEDEQQIGQQICEVLKRAQFTVTHVENASSALRAIEMHEYDLIVLDLFLPDMDGVDVCERIRDIGVDTPLLMLTARSEVEQRVKGLDAGADDYLLKPFSFEELLARIRALFRREKKLCGDIIKIGSVELDTAEYTVRRNGKPVSLTCKEYKLLDYMMRHSNRLCTKTMLEEHVWGHFSLRNSNVIEVTMSRLRKKMNLPGADEFIITRRGIGYVVEDK